MVFWNRRPRLLRLGLNSDATAKLNDVKHCLRLATNISANQIVMCTLSDDGFDNIFVDSMDVASLGTLMLYAVECPSLEDNPSMHEQSVLMFCLSVGSGRRASRRGYPFCLLTNREVQYPELCRRMLSMARPLLRKGLIVQDVPLGAFRIRIVDDYSVGVYLDGAVTMPLYTQDVESALNHGTNRERDRPSLLRLALEWNSSTWDLYLDETVESVLDHPSCSDLVEEMATTGTTLIQCFKEYTRTELLEEWKCDSCKRPQHRAEKSLNLLLRSLPDVLVVHLKRFKHLSEGETIKLDPRIEFPLTSLDLSLFTVQSGSTPVPTRRQHTSKISESALYVNACQNQNLYDLFSVVNHKGDSIDSGHYTALCRNPIDGQWRLFDDTVVSRIDAKQVVSDFQSSSYLLFYERRGGSGPRYANSESGFGEHWSFRLPTKVIHKYGLDSSIDRSQLTCNVLRKPVPLPRTSSSFSSANRRHIQTCSSIETDL